MKSLSHLFSFLRAPMLPLLLAWYPVVYFYSNNLGVASTLSVFRLLTWHSFFAIAVFLLFTRISSRQVVVANVSAALVFTFSFYGLFFNEARRLDFIAIEHFSLIPIAFIFLYYTARSLLKMPDRKAIGFWKVAFSLVSLLLIINLSSILLNKVDLRGHETDEFSDLVVLSPLSSTSHHPDIYYIIFDEMAAFEVARSYWGYNEVVDFGDRLRDMGFYVAEKSHGGAPSTLNQMAERLNYIPFPFTPGKAIREQVQEQSAISDNRVMTYFKAQGYTTVVFSELNSVNIFAAMRSINADLIFEAPEDYVVSQDRTLLDDFMLLVLRNTLLQPWLTEIDLRKYEQHEQMIFYTLEEAPRLDIAGPKFVYIHLLIPHMPFLFDQYGGKLEPTDYENWDRYLGQYIYSLGLAEQLLNDILLFAKNETPVIIFQSDHGARNSGGQNNLQDYPDEYKTWIVNAMLLPGCESAPLSQDMDPINTFPIVFNCYFDANIPLQ